MTKRVLLVILAGLWGAGTAWAGQNPAAKLAMHAVASDEYLDCRDLIPAACESINVDVSAEEILAANGYGYVALVAYDVEGITGAEFAVAGWPMGRGAPLVGPTWCPEGTLTMGNPMDGGAIATFPCVEAGPSGIVLVGYLSFGPLDEAVLPIELEYGPSSFTYPNDPHNYVLDCTVNYHEDSVDALTGCTIGGAHPEQPECVEQLGGDGRVYMETTIDKSYLYILGNYIPRPYHLVLEGDTIRVNGIPVEPLRYRPGPSRPRPPRSEADLQNEAVAREGYKLFDRLRAEGVPTEVLQDSVTAFFLQSGRVNSVDVTSSGVTPHWKEGYWPGHGVFPSVDVPPSFRDPAVLRQRAFDRWRRNLESGLVIGVMHGSVVRDGAPARELHRLIQLYQSGELAQEELERHLIHKSLLKTLAEPGDLCQ